jgi:tetratricopeptide (TPR) repeat protein
MILGNVEYHKIKIIFEDTTGIKQVETTVWRVTDKAGLYEEALKDLDLVIRKNSTFGHSYFIRGLIKIEMGLQDEACEDFYKAKYYGEDEADARIEENCQRS